MRQRALWRDIVEEQSVLKDRRYCGDGERHGDLRAGMRHLGAMRFEQALHAEIRELVSGFERYARIRAMANHWPSANWPTSSTGSNARSG